MAVPQVLTVVVNRGKRNYTLNPRRGYTFHITVNCITPAGVTFDLNEVNGDTEDDWSIRFRAKRSPGSTEVLVDEAYSAGNSFFSGTSLATGVIAVNFSRDETASWDWDRAEYVLEVSNSSGSVRYAVLSGVIAPEDGLDDGEVDIVYLDGGDAYTEFED